MKNLFLAGAAALSLVAIPAGAQDDMATTTTSTEMSASQQTMYDGWPADRQATYTAWPADYQTYYWTLTPDQQEGWWALTDAQRQQVYDLTPEQRTAAWTSIVAQMNGAPAPATATASTAASASMATTGMATSAAASGNIQFVSGERVQATPGDTAAAAGDDLPVCTPNQQDNCINGWEKNKTGNKPLDHWPGKPASEM